MRVIDKATGCGYCLRSSITKCLRLVSVIVRLTAALITRAAQRSVCCLLDYWCAVHGTRKLPTTALGLVPCTALERDRVIIVSKHWCCTAHHFQVLDEC